MFSLIYLKSKVLHLSLSFLALVKIRDKIVDLREYLSFSQFLFNF
jgi:hypothetical protein